MIGLCLFAKQLTTFSRVHPPVDTIKAKTTEMVIMRMEMKLMMMTGQ